jgi:PAS domain S-box-containing protein
MYNDSGTLVGLRWLIRDITERKQAELALQNSERSSEITGRSPEEILGLNWISAIYPEDRPRILHQCNQAISHNQPFYQECRFLHPDGKVVWVIGQALPEIEDNGEALGYIGTITDITERKHSEIALQESEARLKQLIDLNLLGVMFKDSRRANASRHSTPDESFAESSLSHGRFN